MSSSVFDQYLPFLLVFGGCCLAMVFFEYALQQDPGCGNFLTFTELAFISVESLAQRLGRRTKKGESRFDLIASKRDHVTHAVLWVSMSWLVNYAYSFKIAVGEFSIWEIHEFIISHEFPAQVPIHTIVRACNVVATLVLGVLFFGARYSFLQCAAGLLVTVGILLGTLGDANVVGKCQSASIFGCVTGLGGDFTDAAEIALWTVGVGILITCLFMQALLGHIQRRMYDAYISKGASKNDIAEEFLFTSALASLLGSLVFWDEIVLHGRNAAASPTAFEFGVRVPIQALWVLGNNIAQACCIKGVFYLATRFSPLTVNITLSLRKFTTVIISVLWFRNPWSRMHSLATLFVFSGGLLYSSGEFVFRKSTSNSSEKKTKEGGKTEKIPPRKREGKKAQ